MYPHTSMPNHPLPAHSPANSSARLTTVSIPSTTGTLEGLFVPASPSAPIAALLCHPHPLGGGSMHNKVVYHAAKLLQSLRIPVLRFNFRGVGLSQGTHHGSAEVEDVQAAIEWLQLACQLPILTVGFSFGAAIGLRACCRDPRIRAFAALGLPTHAEGRTYEYDFLAGSALPMLFLSGALDTYATPQDIHRIAASLNPPASVCLIPQADHFFTGKLELMQGQLKDWLLARLPELLPESL